jgi:hypothetical protein
VPACVAASPILDALSFVKVAAFETKLEPNDSAFGDHFRESGAKREIQKGKTTFAFASKRYDVTKNLILITFLNRNPSSKKRADLLAVLG